MPSTELQWSVVVFSPMSGFWPHYHPSLVSCKWEMQMQSQPIHIRIKRSNYRRAAALPVPDEQRLGIFPLIFASRRSLALDPDLFFEPCSPLVWFVVSSCPGVLSSGLYDCSLDQCVGSALLPSFSLASIIFLPSFALCFAFHPCSPIFPETQLKWAVCMMGTKCTRVGMGKRK